MALVTVHADDALYSDFGEQVLTVGKLLEQLGFESLTEICGLHFCRKPCSYCHQPSSNSDPLDGATKETGEDVEEGVAKRKAAAIGADDGGDDKR